MNNLLKIILSGIFSISLLSPIEMYAYTPIRVQERTTTTYDSSEGIEASVSYENGKYRVCLFNSNYNDRNDYTSYAFTWYLSYKGKRVSDYMQSKMKCRRSETFTIPGWPGEIPAGYEDYVTVQFGKEEPKRDRRD